MNNNVIILQEQRRSESLSLNCEIKNNLSKVLNSNSYNPNSPDRLLGVDWYDREQTAIQAKYYIGLKWIKEGTSYLLVEPKIKNLDFMSMFMSCFDNECNDVASKLGEIYSIDFNAKPIKINTFQSILTPMLITHFLKLTEGIVRKGLKFNYIEREENLKNKIKGKVLLNKTIKYNYAICRTDRTVCKYQDYSINCPENRILKRTLRFVNKFLTIYNDISCSEDLKRITTYCLGSMDSIQDDISCQQIKQFKINPLYKEYAEALKVAQLILKLFGYDINLIDKNIEQSLPPFWIDMSLLFELYVYGLLKTTYNNNIDYHMSTSGNEIDFVKYDERLIIDTKYITQWEEKVKHDNIRQLSGYARNHKLREKIMSKKVDQTTILPCLVIYPNKDGIVLFEGPMILDQTKLIDTYLKFHKLSVKLPIKEEYKKSY